MPCNSPALLTALWYCESAAVNGKLLVFEETFHQHARTTLPPQLPRISTVPCFRRTALLRYRCYQRWQHPKCGPKNKIREQDSFLPSARPCLFSPSEKKKKRVQPRTRTNRGDGETPFLDGESSGMKDVSADDGADGFDTRGLKTTRTEKSC